MYSFEPKFYSMKTYFLLLTLFASSFVFAQTKSSVANKDTASYRIERSIYLNALKYSDLAVAKNAVYKMIALNPADQSLKDSLLFIYFNAGSFGQSILLCRELLAVDASRSNILEIKAVSEQNLGMVKEALESYEKLFVQSKSIYHQYQIAVLQYQIKRFGECNANLNEIIKNEKATSEKVTITISQQENQQVILKAAALNILGVMNLEGKRDDEAKANFAEALKIQPDFVLAKNNLTLTEKKTKPASPKSASK